MAATVSMIPPITADRTMIKGRLSVEIRCIRDKYYILDSLFEYHQLCKHKNYLITKLTFGFEDDHERITSMRILNATIILSIITGNTALNLQCRMQSIRSPLFAYLKTSDT